MSRLTAALQAPQVPPPPVPVEQEAGAAAATSRAGAAWAQAEPSPCMRTDDVNNLEKVLAASRQLARIASPKSAPPESGRYDSCDEGHPDRMEVLQMFQDHQDRRHNDVEAGDM